MPTPINYRLLRIVKVFLDLTFALSLVGCALLALFLLISPLTMAGGKMADVSVPVVIGSRSIRPVIPVEVTAGEQESISSLRIVDARGELRFETSSWSLHFVSMSLYLIAAFVALSIVYLLRGVLRDVAGDGSFGLKNAQRIRAIGFLFLFAGVLGPIVEHVAARIILARLPAVDPALSAPLSLSPTSC
jgi:hypothetical protein